MIKLLKFLLTGSWHEHTWEVYKEREVTYTDTGERCLRLYLRCSKCGEMKTFEGS